jgi:hypothetical protein
MISFELAQQYNDSVARENPIDPFRFKALRLEGVYLESGLSWAIQEIKPKVILLPWIMAGVLVLYERRKMLSSPEGYEEYSRVHLKPGPRQSRVWGYLGTYKGVELLTLGSTDFAWVTSESDPSLINGTNTVFLKLDGQF